MKDYLSLAGPQCGDRLKYFYMTGYLFIKNKESLGNYAKFQLKLSPLKKLREKGLSNHDVKRYLISRAKK